MTALLAPDTAAGVTDAKPGRAFPLGATVTADGTNFAVASDLADGMLLCLFDADGSEHRVPMVDYDAGVWHALVPGVGPGQRYGFRATGPWDPGRGHLCVETKLLLDPYARAIDGTVTFGPEVLAHADGDPASPSPLDSAGSVPRSVVVDPAFDWGDDAGPGYGYADTIFYELHVKGFTRQHPAVPPDERGTYAGLAHDAVVEHLVTLGVTAVELLPVHHSVPEAFLVARGLTNYWGYNTIGFLAPHVGYSAAGHRGQLGGQVAEFKAMVKRLHAAGLEVILDVVFNHTAEAGPLGPSLCHRGLDNPAYYRLEPDDPSTYIDTTGCGNSLNVGNPVTLRLIMDSLRYWVLDMHVDGFRFDLATALARQDGGFDQTSAFFDLVAQDPVVSQVKLVAEPWDVGQGDSYDLGRFPPLWSEWNGQYRDTMRDFWRGADGRLGAFATRLTGSSDLFGGSRRRPSASVNVLTVHDGFTLRDLVSYDRKHNEANGEDNRDGTDDNRSWNSATPADDGPTTDPAVNALRATRARAMLATLLTSFGPPLLVAGDELGRTQRGNNNAYCQDNEIAWVDWSTVDQSLLDFTRRAIALRRRHPVLRRRRFLTGAETAEIEWFTPAGDPMTGDDWADANARCVAIYLDGSDAPDRDDDGRELVDDDLLVLVDGWWDPIDFVVPATHPPGSWTVELDSADPSGADRMAGAAWGPGDTITVAARSVVVLASRRGTTSAAS
jgi:glycogen operon protein